MTDFWSLFLPVRVFKNACLHNGHLFAILAVIAMEMTEKNFYFSRALLVSSSA